MLGPAHCASGVLAGSVLAAFTPSFVLGGSDAWSTSAGLGLGLSTVIITGGNALAPDFDGDSTATRTMGILGKGISFVTGKLSRAIYLVTRSKYDDPTRPPHRTLTHTLVFALVSGLLTYLIMSLNDTLANIFGTTLASLSFVMVLAGVFQSFYKKFRNGIGVHLTLLLALAIGFLISGPFLKIDSSHAILFGTAVTVGMLTHMLGDAITVKGIPFFAPFITIHGHRWYDVHIVGKLHAASPIANQVIFWGSMLGAAYFILRFAFV